MLRTRSIALFLTLAAISPAGLCHGQIAGPEYILAASHHTIDVGDEVTATVTLDSSLGVHLDGWQYGLCHDPSIVKLTNVDPGSTTENINGNSMVGFYGLQLHASGYTIGVLVDMMATNQLPPAVDHELDKATYEGITPGTSPLEFCNTQGSPPIFAALIAGSDYYLPTTVPGSIEVVGGFSRGDCNDDGSHNVADAVTGLNFLFGGTGATSACTDACDTNNDGSFNIADMVTLLVHLFSNGPDPEPPFPACGVDPDVDSLTCDSYTSCP